MHDAIGGEGERQVGIHTWYSSPTAEIVLLSISIDLPGNKKHAMYRLGQWRETRLKMTYQLEGFGSALD